MEPTTPTPEEPVSADTLLLAEVLRATSAAELGDVLQANQSRIRHKAASGDVSFFIALGMALRTQG